MVASSPSKRRRLTATELTKEVASAVVTRIRCGPRGEAPQSEVRFGIMCEGGKTSPPLWGWSAELLRGELVWVCSAHPVTASFRSTLSEKVQWYDDVRQSVGDGVSVVMFENIHDGPGPKHPVWDLPGLKLVTWFGTKSRFRPPRHWCLRSKCIKHAWLGGVTTGEHTVNVAVPDNASERWQWLPIVGVDADLSHVLDATVMGRPAKANTPSNERTLLDLSKEHWRIPLVVPCVRAATGMVSRILTAGELSKAWDLPETVVTALTDNELRAVTRPGIAPSKLRSYVAEVISAHLAPAEVSHAKRRLVHTIELERVTKRLRVPSEIGNTESVRLIPIGTLEKPQGEVPPPSKDRSHTSIKSDEARVPTHLWDDRLRINEGRKNGELLLLPQIDRALTIVRKFMHRRWCRRVASNFWRWVIDSKAACIKAGTTFDNRAYAPGLAAIEYALKSDWWEWTNGSAPFFWRWPLHARDEIRDGLAPRFIGPPPRYKRPQRVPVDEKTLNQIRKKLEKFRRRGYISKGDVDSLMSLFEVAKGTTDIRIVFDGTECGLNDVLWAPWFSLPSVNTMFRKLDVDYWSADNDFGEMFYNFWLHETLRNLCGVDLTRIFVEELTPHQRTLWERWNRTPMGLKPSPYQAVGAALVFKRVLLGEPHDPTNVFGWSRVVCNIPCSPGYKVGKPWIYKQRTDGYIASDVCIYVDDGRSTAKDEETAWRASSKFAKTASFLGLQDAARKRMAPSQSPEPWFGAKARTTSVNVLRSIAQDRWDKAKRILERVHAEVSDTQGSEGRIAFRQLRKDTGFLMYVAQTYPAMVPYMKGFYLTLYGWRSDRDSDGWKLNAQLLAHQLEQEGDEHLDESDAPELVEPATRLRDDVEALLFLMRDQHPVELPVRPTATARVYVGFGDAAKSGFGIVIGDVTLDVEFDEELHAEHGVWTDYMANQSSNHRELGNFVLFLERALANGTIPRGCEIFLFTDNFVAERAYFRGTASTKLLFDLVLRLRVLQMKGDIFLHLIWCAGTRMIMQGADGLSRGNLDNGVMVGRHMLEYVPIHLSALERSTLLKEWLDGWVGEDTLFFDEEDWFHKAHGADYSSAVWTPCPALADVALEQLNEVRHTQPSKFHVVVVPMVMTYAWRRTLGKMADLIFQVPLGNRVWPAAMHESLTIALVCPLLNRIPWHIRPTKLASNLRADLSGVWHIDCARQGACLRKFWDRTLALDTLPGSVARELLQTDGDGSVPHTKLEGGG
jgi:hypothetical protein